MTPERLLWDLGRQVCQFCQYFVVVVCDDDAVNMNVTTFWYQLVEVIFKWFKKLEEGPSVGPIGIAL